MVRQLWRWALWAWLLALAGCGYSASPVELVIDTLPRDSGPLATLTTLGIADPAASEFGDGVMISSRWSSQRESARTVELNIDLDLAGVPATVVARGEAVELDEPAVALTVVQRRLDGSIAETVTALSERVAVVARSTEGARELSAGRFQMTMPDEDDVAYLHIQGTWRTIPPPPEVVNVPTYPPGDFMTPGDPGPGDPGMGDPGDPGMGDPGDPSGDPGDGQTGYPTVVIFDSGCACPGGGYVEDLPEEDDPDTEPGPADTGGCDCVGDRGEEEEPPPDPTEPEEVVREDLGCDCVGDSGPEEEEVPPPSTTVPQTDTTGDDTGCDCTGDPGVEAPDTDVDAEVDVSVEPASTGNGCAGPDAAAETSSCSSCSGCNDCVGDAAGPVDVVTFARDEPVALASFAPTPSAKPKKVRRVRCRRSPLRIGLELSPVFGLYFLSRWRRRRR